MVVTKLRGSQSTSETVKSLFTRNAKVAVFLPVSKRIEYIPIGVFAHDVELC